MRASLIEKLIVPIAGMSIATVYTILFKPSLFVYVVLYGLYNGAIILVDYNVDIQARIIATRHRIIFAICLMFGLGAVLTGLKPQLNEQLSELLSPASQSEQQASTQSGLPLKVDSLKSPDVPTRPSDQNAISSLGTGTDAQDKLDYLVPFAFFVQGSAVGLALWWLLSQILIATFKARSTFSYKIYFQAAVLLFLILLPVDIHKAYMPLYLAGLTFGLFIIHLEHTVRLKNAEKKRRRDYVNAVQRLRQTHLEDKFKNYYANGKHKKVIKGIRDLSNEKCTSYLLMIQAASLRVRGGYSEAIVTLERAMDLAKTELADNSNSELKDTLNFCLLGLAINKRDANQGTEADELIEKISRNSRDCLLANATTSLFKAEDAITIDEENKRYDVNVTKEPLFYADRALDQNAKTKLEDYGEWSLLLTFSVPMSRTFLLDAWAFAHHAAGRIFEPSMLFLQCVFTDPNYSAAYLHLGESYIVRFISDLVPWTSKPRLSTILLCLKTCEYMEGDRQSETRRRARRLIDIVSSGRLQGYISSQAAATVHEAKTTV